MHRYGLKCIGGSCGLKCVVDLADINTLVGPAGLICQWAYGCRYADGSHRFGCVGGPHGLGCLMGPMDVDAPVGLAVLVPLILVAFVPWFLVYPPRLANSYCQSTG